MRNTSLIIAVVLLVVAVVIIAYALRGRETTSNRDNLNNTSDKNNSLTQNNNTSENQSTSLVIIKDFNFVPSTIQIKKGDTVIWRNDDLSSHTIEGTTDKNMKSANLDKGGTYQNTFNVAGTFEYICGIHPSMKGTVVVEG